MILPDANLLIYAVNTSAHRHEEARLWVEETLAGKRGTVVLSWFTLVAFVRIVTNRKALANPFTLDEALQIVRGWLSLPAVTFVGPGINHLAHFETTCRSVQASGNLITDSHLAALAIEHDLELASCDTDFAKFPGLRWINPLQP